MYLKNIENAALLSYQSLFSITKKQQQQQQQTNLFTYVNLCVLTTLQKRKWSYLLQTKLFLKVSSNHFLEDVSIYLDLDHLYALCSKTIDHI